VAANWLVQHLVAGVNGTGARNAEARDVGVSCAGARGECGNAGARGRAAKQGRAGVRATVKGCGGGGAGVRSRWLVARAANGWPVWVRMKKSEPVWVRMKKSEPVRKKRKKSASVKIQACTEI